jgi:hypothetical protein
LEEWRLAGETEVLGENLPQRHFIHHKIPHDQTRALTWAAAVGSQWITAWAMARPYWRDDRSLISEASRNFSGIKVTGTLILPFASL